MKTMIERWFEFKAQCVPDNAGPDQVMAIKCAFFAGALETTHAQKELAATLSEMSPEALLKMRDQQLAIIDQIEDECQKLADLYKDQLYPDRPNPNN